jgi:3-deoxy-D-manno-octulosonic-acid transferase
VYRVLEFVDLALMQGERDAARIVSLGAAAEKTTVTGNLKFDQQVEVSENSLTSQLRERFNVSPDRPLIIAASTHSPEERWMLESFAKVKGIINGVRIMIAPRHPEGFGEVWESIENSRFSAVRRSAAASPQDKNADVILLDSIGELRAAYPLAEIVFVGGSLIPHGGQSVLEPAAAGRAIITGPFTHNFDAVVKEFLEKDALVQLTDSGELYEGLVDLLENLEKRHQLAENALAVMETNRGASLRTVERLREIFHQTNVN